uniref:phosphoribosylaminoimidazolesuccinocarboxamide synthase n=1 Tax=Pyramimonas obovata TaxID=1411642 RepID=A0A7S0MWT4_9CHLO|mmetsp:Transcript_12783/g.26972  ORF Transcript_12783/g.26972 Transcript_12783/m.26972 type:complete len:409 (+) Transcript_12783:65-1291(+)|eukprot:CAMPEP_0118931966 /NCGR_PEP_ID=MMETSP1169-20130426/8848_1 /TAXON_ID=36882 /ORGANISM="Pyramimonas obovata, Strain CCMP722" /LENGTH=408 /DNA_ID=CAMNT_0006874549 /DNA_START=64 /DNA_END=1290 /DNA_ORIENTATION=+
MSSVLANAPVVCAQRTSASRTSKVEARATRVAHHARSTSAAFLKGGAVTAKQSVNRRASRAKQLTVAAAVERQAYDTSPELEDAIQKAIGNCLTETNLGMGEKRQGKVRDFYDLGDLLVLVTSDRQSAFDRMLATIPFKGQVLNMTSSWWFNNTTHICKNALLATPDPSVAIMKKLELIPVEMVARGYMTGSTETSLWTHYKNGSRDYCGNILAEGMVKNQKLPENILTPTTKGVVDRPISKEDIVKEGLMTQAEWDGISKATLELFAFGQQEAAKRGLILVDTKYEFGRDGLGNFYLIDEVHTPDSSRYWVKDSFDSRLAAGMEPENIDKEFLRLWFRDNCDPYNDEVLPAAPDDLVSELSRRYIRLYQTITGETFKPALADFYESRADQIKNAVIESLAEIRGEGN